MKIQGVLEAPKNQTNAFGNYKYRSAEDILKAVKPLLSENNCILTITDTINLVGNRYYITATATITSTETKESVSVTAHAREEEVKKGMDSAQITGSASSYARKYALNGLFCIDDTKDPDATNDHGRGKKPEPVDENFEQDLAIAIDEAKRAATQEDLTKVWKIWLPYQKVQSFREAVKVKGEQFKTQNNA